MTAASPPTWPSSRVLAGWWPGLDRLRPRSLWLYHLLLHRVDAPVAIARPAAQDRFARLLLEQLSVVRCPLSVRNSASLTTGNWQLTTDLAARLHVDPQLLWRFLVDLEKTGLVRCLPAEQSWALTVEGQQVLAGERSLRPLHERRTFYFVEPPRPGAPPHFIPLDRPSTSAWLRAESWRFDVSRLQGCAEQSVEWKRRHGFPIEVLGLGNSAGEPWEQVVIDRPVQMLALFVLAGIDGTEETLLGFAVQPEGWRLQTERPVLTLGESWPEVLPELADDLSPDAWRQAWQTWGQVHGRQPDDVESCSLEPKGLRLRVRAPQPLAEQLHSSRGDLKGEMWVFAGEGRLRSAAMIEALPPPQSGAQG